MGEIQVLEAKNHTIENRQIWGKNADSLSEIEILLEIGETPMHFLIAELSIYSILGV